MTEEKRQLLVELSAKMNEASRMLGDMLRSDTEPSKEGLRDLSNGIVSVYGGIIAVSKDAPKQCDLDALPKQEKDTTFLATCIADGVQMRCRANQNGTYSIFLDGNIQRWCNMSKHTFSTRYKL